MANHVKSTSREYWLQTWRGPPGHLFQRRARDNDLVHGDDYVSSALSEDLDWLERELGKAYEIKTQRTKPDGDKEVEAKILNRVVRRTKEGYEMEADPRHAELIIEQLLEPEARTLSTPGSNTEVSIDDAKELEGEEATRYRAIAARCNYLSIDRPDLQFSVKELCRDMSRPTDQSWARLRRVGQFIKSRPRVVWKFQWQDQAACVDVYADAN